MFREFTGIKVSKLVSQRNAERAGAVYEEIQKAEVEWLQKKMPCATVHPDKLQISADGAMVPLLHGAWAEVRTLVIGEVQPAVREKGDMVVHTRNLSYFSRKMSSAEFETASLGEMHRRGVQNAKAVAAVIATAWGRMAAKFHGLSLSACSAHPRFCTRSRTHQPGGRVSIWRTYRRKQDLVERTFASIET